jgi:hypothetical protein
MHLSFHDFYLAFDAAPFKPHGTQSRKAKSTA